MTDFAPYLSWIDSQQSRMVSLVSRWANINSGTYHLAGLHHLSQAIQLEFACLHADSIEHLALSPHKRIDSRGNFVEMPLGEALRFRKRVDAARRVFLCIHMDTVYPQDSPFQATTLRDGSLVSERKGSGNFTVVARGRSAHAGRNPQDGRSAILALSQIVLALHDLPRQLPGLTVNVGQIEGGGALNMVPDLAIA